MSAKRLERPIPYVDDPGEVSYFTCHACHKEYYGNDSSSRRFHYCPMCGVTIDHTPHIPRNAEKHRRKTLRSSVVKKKTPARRYHIRIENADGSPLFDHYNKKPRGQYWNWYECGFIVGGLSMENTSNIGCRAVLNSFRAKCDRFAGGFRGYMEATMGLPSGVYRLTLVRDGIPSVSRVVYSVKPIY